MKEMIHLGNNIRRIRELKGIKQETFAEMMGLTQAAISKLEATAKIDDERLKEVAEKLGTNVEAIKRATAETIMFHIETMNDNSGNFNVYEIHPLEKITELYEKILKEKNEDIEKLKQELGRK